MTVQPLRVTAAVIRHSGEVLLARRQAGGHLEGYREVPGGKIESGESPEQCLARELHEELGLRAEVGEFIISSRFDDGALEVELLAYEVNLATGTYSRRSHDEVRWAPTSDLLDFDLAPADIPIAKAIVSDNPKNQGTSVLAL